MILKKWWAEVHLKYICHKCPYEKKHARDIFHNGTCWWNSEWKKGNYKNLPFWMGVWNFIRLYIFGKVIRICIDGKYYDGYKYKPKKEKKQEKIPC